MGVQRITNIGDFRSGVRLLTMLFSGERRLYYVGHVHSAQVFRHWESKLSKAFGRRLRTQSKRKSKLRCVNKPEFLEMHMESGSCERASVLRCVQKYSYIPVVYYPASQANFHAHCWYYSFVALKVSNFESANKDRLHFSILSGQGWSQNAPSLIC